MKLIRSLQALQRIPRAIASFALLTTVLPLAAEESPKPGSDPFAGAFFPPEVVMMARDQIGLTSEQQSTLQAQAEKANARSEELRTNLEHESAALAALAKQDHVDHAALDAQLDKVLDIERELKHLHLGVATEIKNLLTPEQQAKLRGIAKAGIKELAETTRKRLTDKLEQVKEEAQKWASNGRDPSDAMRSMEEKFQPLMQSGKTAEAEAELDRVLDLLAK